ncbi:hypothetical protein PAHAL_5G493200 [Panicum hallii]|uniref:Uncharacterized protein n=1 Tax=Panicum hallii TaxID=206008 RepID=A0A2T8INZ1_9POAL|nr:hypothetical protein PAHAL_5G493200 [Panicum hallii]
MAPILPPSRDSTTQVEEEEEEAEQTRVKWMKEVWDKERRLTETESTPRRTGGEEAPPGSGDGGEGEGRPAMK